MSEPEIARRCGSCGASIRERAFFCPQCGDAVGPKVSTEVADLPADETRLEAPNDGASVLPTETAPIPNPVLADPIEPNVASSQPAEAFGARQRIQRAAAGARETVEGDVVQRVERLRKISNTVIDQAAYDPSLRFILVAAALFIVFLIILIWSELLS